MKKITDPSDTGLPLLVTAAKNVTDCPGVEGFTKEKTLVVVGAESANAVSAMN